MSGVSVSKTVVGSGAIGEARDRLITRVLWLSWFTIAYNLIEGVVSVGFGVAEESVSLAGFGLDSFIEVASALIVIWRFKGESGLGASLELERERRATLGIGILFLALALVTGLASGLQLWRQEHPATTIPGVVISALSLSFMFYLWNAKKKAGKALASPTVLKDAACSLACIKLSVTLFLGSLLFAIFPSFWWADATAGGVLALLIAKEGWETIQAARSEDFSGGGCGCSEEC